MLTKRILDRLTLAFSVLPDRVCAFFFRTCLGAKVGKGVHFGALSVIDAEEIEIGDFVSVGRKTRIHAKKVILGSRVFIGHSVEIEVFKLEMAPRAIISERSEIKGCCDDPRSEMIMGKRAWIFQDCFVNVARSVRLGKATGLGGGSYIFTHGSWLSELDGFPTKFGEVAIGDNVWLPWGCFVLPGVKIGNNVVVGARSVLNRDVPDGVTVAGVPAKVVRESSSVSVSLEEKIKILEEITRDYCITYNKELSVKHEGSSVIFSIDSQEVVRIHKAIDAVRISPNAINLFFEKIDSTLYFKAPCFCLVDYSSSPEAMFNDVVKRWLQYITHIGVRFYPVDE